MDSILKDIIRWKRSFISPMTPAEVDGYTMVEKCEEAIKERNKEIVVLKTKVAQK